MDARTRAFIRGPRSSRRSTTTRAQQRPPRPAAAPAAPIHAYFVQYVRDSTHATDARHQMGGASGQEAGRHAARMLGDAQGALRANSGPMTSRGRRRPVPTKRPPIRRTPHAAATQRTAQHSTAQPAEHSTPQHTTAQRCAAQHRGCCTVGGRPSVAPRKWAVASTGKWCSTAVVHGPRSTRPVAGLAARPRPTPLPLGA